MAYDVEMITVIHGLMSQHDVSFVQQTKKLKNQNYIKSVQNCKWHFPPEVYVSLVNKFHT